MLLRPGDLALLSAAFPVYTTRGRQTAAWCGARPGRNMLLNAAPGRHVAETRCLLKHVTRRHSTPIPLRAVYRAVTTGNGFAGPTRAHGPTGAQGPTHTHGPTEAHGPTDSHGPTRATRAHGSRRFCSPRSRAKSHGACPRRPFCSPGSSAEAWCALRLGAPST